MITSEFGGSSAMQACDIETLKNNKLDCLVGFNNYYKLNNNSWKIVDYKIEGKYPITENIKVNNSSSNKITTKEAYALLTSIAKLEQGFRFESFALITLPSKTYIPAKIRNKTVYGFTEANDYIEISRYYVTENSSVYKNTETRENM